MTTQFNACFKQELDRRNMLPIIYVKGSYYEVGYDIGRTFSNYIQEYLNRLSVLNDVYIPLFNTDVGKQVYNETLEAINQVFPQYVKELEGIADGAQVPFYKLFLLHLDDVLPNVVEKKITNVGQGCSTFIINKGDQVSITHNEDGFKEAINNVYVVNAIITEVEPNEVFTAFCYPGILPGYAMSFNQHFAFTVNIIASQNLCSGKIPRTFAMRAMLGVTSLEQIEVILRYAGCGVADALSINLAMFRRGATPLFYNIEAAPSDSSCTESIFDIKYIKIGEHYFHCNRFLHLDSPEAEGTLYNSSIIRHQTQSNLPIPRCKKQIFDILGDESQKNSNIFKNDANEKIVTLATGYFDFDKNTFSVYMGNPKFSVPVAVMPLYNKFIYLL